MLTEILLEVTNSEILEVVREVLEGQGKVIICSCTCYSYKYSNAIFFKVAYTCTCTCTYNAHFQGKIVYW